MKAKTQKFRALVWMRVLHTFVVVKIKAEDASAAADRAKSLSSSYNAKFIELVK